MKKIIFLLLAIILCNCSLFQSDSSKIDMSLIPVYDGKRWGFVDQKGKYVINPQFKDAYYFQNDIARVISSDGLTGYISKNGKFIVTPKFIDGTDFNDGLAIVVSVGGHPTCIDKEGKEVFKLSTAKWVSSFSEGLSAFSTKEDKIGFVNKQGEIVINPQFEDFEPFSEGLAAVCDKNNKWGFVDTKGNLTINYQFEEVASFHEGFAVFQQGDKYGYIDKNGQYIINPQFELAGDFHNGMAIVAQGNNWGYIDTKGTFVINPQFTFTAHFNQKKAFVYSNDKWGVIDTKGKYIINPQYENYICGFEDGVAIVGSGDKYGFIDAKGKYVANPQFDNVKTHQYQTQKIISNYYDCSAFLENFFKRATKDGIDGYTKGATLETIANMKKFEDINAKTEYTASVDIDEDITDDIYLSDVVFSFSSPIYTKVTTYDYWYGYSTRKQYKFQSKSNAIMYSFDLGGDAYGKSKAVANAIKTKVESLYGITLLPGNKEDLLKDSFSYYCLSDGNKPGCVIITRYEPTNYDEVIFIWGYFDSIDAALKGGYNKINEEVEVVEVADADHVVEEVPVVEEVVVPEEIRVIPSKSRY